MNEEEIRALKELEYDLKEHNTKYAKNYEDVCYNSLIKLQQENKQLKQQLKDKDEKINNVIEYIKENIKAELLNGSIWIDKCKLLNILESNKED